MVQSHQIDSHCRLLKPELYSYGPTDPHVTLQCGAPGRGRVQLVHL